MRRIALLLLLAALSGHAAAEWTRVGSGARFSAYVDYATAYKEGSKVQVWTLYDHQSTQELPAAGPYLSLSQHEEYDCKEPSVRVVFRNYYSGNMAGGQVIYADNTPYGPAGAVMPGSLAAIVWKVVCQ